MMMMTGGRAAETTKRRSIKTGCERRRSLMGNLFAEGCWKPVDFVAVGLMLVTGSLIALGHDSTVTAILLAVSAYYFGHGRTHDGE